MIDIYNEEDYIKNIIESGLSSKWERDVRIMVRYWKEYEGLKKSEIRKKAQEKCLTAATRQDNPISYDEFRDIQRLNKAIDSAYRKDEKLRKIQYIDISKEVLDWFLSLEQNFTLTDEQAKDIKSRRKRITFKGNHPINFERTKYLFTLYIWTKIQEHYLERPNVHYLEQYARRFREDAHLKASFNLDNECNLLSDVGLISVNFSRGITTTFMDNYEVFKTPITEDNKIRILTRNIPQDVVGRENSTTIYSGQEPVVTTREMMDTNLYDENCMNLYNPGYWLTVKKFGTFKCEKCGKEFIHYGISKGEAGRKYCKQCARLTKHNQDKPYTRTQWCVDCGNLIEDNTGLSHTKCRCKACQEKRNKELNKVYQARFKAKGKETAEFVENP